MTYTTKSLLSGFGAFAGAGILAVGVVAAPPDPHSARTEVRAVQLTASVWPGAATLTALEHFVSQQAQTVLPAGKRLAAGGTTTPGVTVSNPTGGVPSLKLGSAADSQTADAATLAEPAALSASAVPSALTPLLGFVAVLILFAPLIIGVILLCPICAVINELSYFIPGVSPVGALAATSEISAPAVETATFAGDVTTGEPADAAPPTDPGKKDDFPKGTSNGKRTHGDAVTEEKRATAKETTGNATEAKKDVTEAEDASEANTPEPSLSAPKPEKGAERGSHRGEDGHQTTRSVAAAGGTSATDGSSSPGPSHGNGNHPSGDKSSDDNGDGS